MTLLSGKMGIKNAGLKSTNKRRTFDYCLAPIRSWDWCVSEDEKNKNKNVFFDHLI